jgi:hypothetical protein
MRKFLKLVALIVFNLVVIVVLLEILLRVTASFLPAQYASAVRRVTTGQAYPQAWTPAWQQNPDHYWILKPGITDALQYGSPTVSFHLTTIELWENGGIGFRTRPVDYFVDAVVVGDSFGLCFTEQADCWVEQLSGQFAPPLGMVNLSQPVTGTTSHLRILEGFGAPLKPPLVIWQFFGNDFNDDYGLAVFRKDLEPVANSQPAPETSSAPALVTWLRDHSAVYAVVEAALLGGQAVGSTDYERLFIKPYTVKIDETTMRFGAPYEQQAMDMALPQNQIGRDQSAQAFEEAQNLVESWNGQLVVVVIPTREEVYADLTEPLMGADAIAKLTSAREAMFAVCEAQNLLCYDPLSELQARAKQGELLYFADDMHLNPHGNAVLAHMLAAWLDEQGLTGDKTLQLSKLDAALDT